MEEKVLIHHGIKGQHWGRKNGPPYPLGYGDHTSEQKKKNSKGSLDNYGGMTIREKRKEEKKIRKSIKSNKEMINMLSDAEKTQQKKAEKSYNKAQKAAKKDNPKRFAKSASDANKYLDNRDYIRALKNQAKTNNYNLREELGKTGAQKYTKKEQKEFKKDYDKAKKTQKYGDTKLFDELNRDNKLQDLKNEAIKKREKYDSLVDNVHMSDSDFKKYVNSTPSVKKAWDESINANKKYEKYGQQKIEDLFGKYADEDTHTTLVKYKYH